MEKITHNSDFGIVLQLTVAAFGVAFFAMYKAMPRHKPYTGQERNWWVGIFFFLALFIYNFFGAKMAWSPAYNRSDGYKFVKTAFQIVWAIHVFVYVIIPVIKKVDFAGAKYKKI